MAEADDAAVRLEPAIPVLRIFDEAVAWDFYEGYLGFTRDWEHRFGPSFPLYTQVSRGGLSLHLTGHHGDATPGSAVYIRLHGIRSLHAELSAKAYRFARPGLEETPWGTLELSVTDPFGNRLRFAETLTGPHADPR